MTRASVRETPLRSLAGKRILITGASRGIGAAIARRAAHDGARIALIAKTEEPHPTLPGTIHTVADEIREAGGEALPIATDLRFDDQIELAVEQTVARLGGLDVLVNNASAIFLAGTSDTPMKRFDLMFGVNVRATFAMSRACLPHLERSENAHILNLAPPLDLQAKWFAPHLAYTMSKYGMSLCTLGLSEELRSKGIAVNSLWPRTVIATAALRMLGGAVDPRRCRKPEIVADAAHAVLSRPAGECTGRFLIDEHVLRSAGVADFEPYAVEPGNELLTDLFLEEDD